MSGNVSWRSFKNRCKIFLYCDKKVTLFKYVFRTIEQSNKENTDAQKPTSFFK